MSRRNSLIAALAFGIIGIAAALFVFAPQANQGIALVNEKTPSSVRLPLISEKPFHLGLDLQGGIHLVYEADLTQVQDSEQDSAMEGLRDVIERRVNLFGVTEPLVQTEGSGEKQRLIVELAGIQDPGQAAEIIGQTPYLEFREPKENYQEIQERNQRILKGEEEGQIEDPFAPTQLTGRFLKQSTLGFEVANQPIIQLEFNEEGSQLFQELTAKNVGRPVAIYLDGQPLSAPIVQQEISGGRAQISGSFTVEEARQIVRELNAGALPVPITLLSQEYVGPTLGQISLDKSLRAGIGGLFLVGLFMILFYRLPGLVAILSLLFYLSLVLLVIKAASLTVSLAGIAGLVLSIGMAVDTNILIFSRLREELRNSGSLSGALEEGFHRAWPAIRDGNVTTLLVAAILFFVGTSFVQGFALMLSLGIVVSMFSAFFVTKSLLHALDTKLFSRLSWLWT